MAAQGRPPAVVSAHGLEYRYRSGRPGLRHVDLEVRPGEILTLLGPNGSGKSTLLRLLATDLRPTGGTLSIFGGTDLSSPRRLRRRIGYAPDTPVHILPLTGEENAALFAELGGAERPMPERTSALVDSFGLADVRRTPVAEYSFGMRRKLLLVEALAPGQDLILLDEPSVGLDPAGTSALRETLRRSAEDGAAVVVASNETRDLPLWGTRIAFLHEGVIVEDAAVESLLARLGTGTRIEVAFEEEDAPGASRGDADTMLIERLLTLDGVEEARLVGRILEVRSVSGGRVLPPLVAALIGEGFAIREVHVREPELADLFFTLTGERLVTEAPATPRSEVVRS